MSYIVFELSSCVPFVAVAIFMSMDTFFLVAV